MRSQTYGQKDRTAWTMYRQTLAKATLLSAEEETTLFHTLRESTRERQRMAARDRIIEANLRLVVMVAKRFTGFGVPLEDLIEEGNIGLILAVDRFDPDRGCRFATYALHWIHREISQVVRCSRFPVHLPHSLAVLRVRIKAAENAVLQEEGRLPTTQELALRTGGHPEEITRLRALDVLSIDDNPDPDDPGASLASRLAAPSQDVEEHLNRKELLHWAHDAARRVLGRKQGDVFFMRQHGETLQNIGQRFGVSRERVRQWVNSAGNRVQHQVKRDGWNPRKRVQCA